MRNQLQEREIEGEGARERERSCKYNLREGVVRLGAAASSRQKEGVREGVVVS